MKVNIKINEKFSIQKNDGCNYNLIENYHTEPKEGFDSKESTKVLGHYSSTLSALRAYVDRSLDDCATIKEVVDHVSEVQKELEVLFK